VLSALNSVDAGRGGFCLSAAYPHLPADRRLFPLAFRSGIAQTTKAPRCLRL